MDAAACCTPCVRRPGGGQQWCDKILINDEPWKVLRCGLLGHTRLLYVTALAGLGWAGLS